jgi:hypothetical protein
VARDTWRAAVGRDAAGRDAGDPDEQAARAAVRPIKVSASTASPRKRVTGVLGIAIGSVLFGMLGSPGLRELRLT